jgi:hypothetical protein
MSGDDTHSASYETTEAPPMKRRHRLLAFAAAGLSLVVFAPPAFADDATSTATLTITGGTLEITVQDASDHLGKMTSSADGGVLTGHLGQVVVTDRRSAPAGSGWVASAVSTPFTTPHGPAIPASRIRYTAGTITKTGTATYTANDPKSLRKTIAVVTATDVTGNNTATWTPTLTVDVPGNTVAGTYSATITHSVL